MKSAILSFVLAAILAASSATPTNMIIILLDGFRWDYSTIHAGEGLPGFERFSTSGVKAKYLNPVFPANSFPNWRTIVTGLYPENHGIVSNYMYDQEREKEFDLQRLETTSDAEWWSEAEPLWITTTKNDLDTALIHWSRCDVPWKGILPKYCEPYKYVPSDTIHKFRFNLGRTLDMVQDEGYKLVMLYEEGVDEMGHLHGPLSTEVVSFIREVDEVLENLWEELETRDLINTTNVVLVSDHGMTSTGPNAMDKAEIGDCLQTHQDLLITEYGSFVNILAPHGDAHKVVESIQNCQGVGDKVMAYKKEDLPERYHYKSHRLISHVVVIAKPGYSISVSGIEKIPRKTPQYEGDHGFDNTMDQNLDMRGILMAHGPDFASGVVTGGVEQVDVYGLLCRGLRLSCLPNNGSWSRVESFFVSPQQEVEAPGLLSLILLVSFTLIVAAVLLYYIGGGGSWSL